MLQEYWPPTRESQVHDSIQKDTPSPYLPRWFNALKYALVLVSEDLNSNFSSADY